ncbi:MAG: hypothetical protein A4E56_03366 [Pelotomaculum sp. PtaU1.Bin065]|nr:MAG: hypothetical protein A4E56_03366 [Pelotomaculum sp. PtaU1.Bin065]
MSNLNSEFGMRNSELSESICSCLFDSAFRILNSELIFSPARRIRSLPISHIFLKPALAASLSGAQGSANCTMMNLRLPPSSALSCMTAWAVVAEPEKKSRMILSSSVLASVRSLRNKRTGFGPSKCPLPSKRATTSFAPSWLWPTSL